MKKRPAPQLFVSRELVSVSPELIENLVENVHTARARVVELETLVKRLSERCAAQSEALAEKAGN